MDKELLALASLVNYARTLTGMPVDAFTTSGNSREDLIAAIKAKFPRTRSVYGFVTLLQHVRECFSRDPKSYDSFFGALGEYQDKKASLTSTVERIALVCSGSPPLLRSLNFFLPEGYRIDVLMGDSGMELHMPDGVIKHPLRTLPGPGSTYTLPKWQ